MIRNIRFRAWDKKKKKMLPVLGINFKFWYSADRDGDVEFYEDSPEEGSVLIQSKGRPKEWNWILNEYVELMQYTGLKDKNKKRIFDKDMLKFKSQSMLSNLSGKPMKERIEMIHWNDNELCWWVGGDLTGFKPNMSTDNNKFEIIGDIYRNPELLEVE